MLRVCAACGSGMGSSQIIKMKMEKVFKQLNIDAKISHSSISLAKSSAFEYDVIFCSQGLINNFDNAISKGVKVIGLKNLLSEQELKEKIEANILNK